MKLVNNLDLNQYEARNMKLQNLATAPGSPTVGQVYYDTAMSTTRVWTGSTWLNLGQQGTVTAVNATSPITSSGGTTPTIGINAATTSAAGSMSAADKTKLDGVASGATANQTDAYLLSRSNHTGSQAISTVTNLQTTLDAKIAATEKGAANGVATLDGGGKIPTSQLPNLAVTDVSVVATIVARDALVVEEGDVAIVTGTSQTFIYDGTQWQELSSPVDGVQTVSAGTGISVTGTASNPTVGIANSGVTATQIATSVAGNGLTGGGGTALAVNPGSGIEVVSNAVRIAAAAAGNGLTGGAGSALAVGAGTGISVAATTVGIDTAVVVRKYATTLATSATSYTITHNLGTRDVQVTVYANATPWDEVLADVEHTDTNTVTVRFGVAPAANAYRVAVVG